MGKDWDIADRPPHSTNQNGVLDGIFVPKEEKDSYNLGFSPLSMLIGQELGCCGAVDRVSDHSLLWIVEKHFAVGSSPVTYWPKFHVIVQFAIIALFLILIIVIIK